MCQQFSHSFIIISKMFSGRTISFGTNSRENRTVLERKAQFKKPISAACILRVAERRMILLFRAEGAAGSLVGLQGCEPRTFCQLAQQPWQEVSLQTWWSHSNRKHAHPPPPSPPPAQQTRSAFFPAENTEKWQSWFTLPHWAHHRQNSSQQFSAECHPRQKTEMGSDLSGRDEHSSCSHLHEDNSVQMHRVWDLQHNSPPGLERHLHNTFGIH